ncbi:MAG: IS1595 family transposase [Rhizobiaceae bacterium]
MSTKPLTTTQFFRQFPDDETCLRHLFDVRFGQGHTCPSCERPSRWYRIKAERAYSCQFCGHHLHPTVGTPFEKTRTPLQLWFYAIHLFTTTRHGVSAKELQRQLGVTYKTAWRMAGLIREHMADVDGEAPIGGFMKRVEVDETFVGGVAEGHGTGNYMVNKTVVLGMLERGGNLIAHVVPDRSGGTILPVIRQNVKPNTEIHTDEWVGYKPLDLMGAGYWHKSVNHSRDEYVSPAGATVNAIESFWRHLKCSISGTHTSVSRKYLARYVKEFEFRFNRRNDPGSMFPALISTFRR